MSDEEGGWQEEEEKSKPKKHAEEKGEEKTEAQLLMEAKQRKHEEEEVERLQALEEQRRHEREKEEEELRRLKEKQAQRKKEREEEERKMEIQRQQIEEQRKLEEEQRKQEKEDEKRRKQEEAERKKAAATAAIAGGRNFVVNANREGGETSMDKFMNISKAKTEMGLNANELEVLKRRTVEDRVRPLSVADMDFKSLQKKAEELWKQIISLETSKYDLTERSKRQEYDLKELNERQRQTNQKRYVAQGLDVEAGSTRHPPKVQIVSKYERRTDRRTFVDRKGLYDGSNLQNEEKEVARPKAVKRDNWIKPKEVEKKRGSRDEVEEDEEPAHQSSRQEDSHRAEVAADEEEEE